jgi:Ca2+-binding EF-hand superfamily protein
MDIIGLFHEIDTDQSGTLSQQEFIEFYMDKFFALEERRV